MHGLHKVIVTLACVGGTVLGTTGTANAAPAGDSLAAAARPNIVLIISDDQAWSDYSFAGHPHIRTPNIDRLAEASLTFTRGYVTSSLCCPSLATIITGLYPHQHKITSNDPPRPQVVPPGGRQRSAEFLAGRERMCQHLEAVATLPRLLARDGYVSLQTGKWWQGDYRRGGFTHGMTRGDRHGDAGLEIGRVTLQPIYDFIAEARSATRPFLVWYAPMMPHSPHSPPERLLAKYRDVAPTLPVARYWAMVEWFDETVGDLLKHLDDKGLADDTIVVYVTDNGWITNPTTGEFAARSKTSPYEAGLRTPIMIRWPGHVRPQRSHALASSIDLVPTLLAALEFEPPAGLPGINLLDDAAVSARTAIFGECFTHDSRDLEEPAVSLRWRWMIDGEWKLIVPAPQNEGDAAVELYNLADDPREDRDAASDHRERVAEMRQELNAWWKGTSPPSQQRSSLPEP